MVAKTFKTQDEVMAALRSVRVWETNKEEPVDCPMCGAPGLKISDHSARPYSEWYLIECPTCGLDDKIHIPTSPARAF